MDEILSVFPKELVNIVNEYNGNINYNKCVRQLSGIIYSWKCEVEKVEIVVTIRNIEYKSNLYIGNRKKEAIIYSMDNKQSTHRDIVSALSIVNKLVEYDTAKCAAWRIQYFIPYKKKEKKSLFQKLLNTARCLRM